MNCQCLTGTAYFWRDDIEHADEMCTGTLGWLLKNDIVQAESPCFISENDVRLEWNGKALLVMR